MRRGEWARDPDALYEQSRRGAITVARLEQLGVPPRTSYRRCAPGQPWRRLLPGVLLLSSAEPTRRQLVEAALLYAGPDAVVTGAESCRRQGMRTLCDEERVHLLVPAGYKVGTVGSVVVERTTRMPEPVVRGELPLAPLGRAVLDECRRMRRTAPVAALLTEVVQRGKVSPSTLADELACGSSRGSAHPRSVLGKVLAGARSVAEVDAMRVWRLTGLPRPVWNVELRDSAGRYVAIPDAWCDEVGLAWEIDSLEFHYRREDYAATLERNARYAAAGVIVVQSLPGRLRTEPRRVAAELVAAYRAAAARQRPRVRVSAG
ncbi:hypothetical protein [Amycolatopsis samaneae]|uniref:Transcriptional regulator, AbiEi antitoxin, Type IV TA system n=1 Tax=Amycolatopsis samaneae TaxID=664691 RepID=A0ABW5GPP6_9PSEU